MPKKKPIKRIVKAKIDFISLCPKGANSLSTIYKSDDGDKGVELSTICKDMNEQGEIIAAVYVPEMVDSQGDIASAAVIKEFAHDFQKNGAGIDIRHNEDVVSKDAVYVAESFIIQKDDPRFADIKDYDGNPADVTGGWGVVLKVDDEDLRKLYRSGEWGGVSMGGTAHKKEDTSVAKVIKDAFVSLGILKDKEIKKQKNTENTMALNAEDLKKVAEVAADTVTKTLDARDKVAKEAAAEKLKKEQEDGKKLGLGLTAPVLKDSSDKGMTEHRKRLEIFELSKSVDSEDSRAVFNFQEKAKEIAKSKDLDKTLNKQVTDQYDSFFVTNQSTEEIEKADLTSGDDDGGVAEVIEKSLDDADKKD